MGLNELWHRARLDDSNLILFKLPTSPSVNDNPPPPQAYGPLVHGVRPHPGQLLSAGMMRALVPVGSNDPSKRDVQDPYSLRCAPQVHGCVIEQVQTCLDQFHIEVNSAVDNPLIFAETGQLISGGNFHGEYVAKAFDALGM